ncbi:hypothetical protein AJ80_07690 [Polytolypa hystricis UAMH7299]|uniref:PQ-loop-domain-containing protein n=1 Tax=Polytolypa hystricis (strain UAMH7299) TaxID=1447883 RepID=A0A2B7XKG1_POLH7|nr:hypothetical protein AJ80_07690 [Polytolypa hystricis UAMH7299]
MFPPPPGEHLDIEALSGICGSISIACWVVVFSPQIIENFRRGSADGLSIVFLVVWLAGDVFNILGSVLQGVLPTMIILAVYYTLADIVLLCQCFYYRGFTLSDYPTKAQQKRPSQQPDAETAASALQAPEDEEERPSRDPSERLPLLMPGETPPTRIAREPPPPPRLHRRPSLESLRERLVKHLSPAMPLVSPERPSSPRTTRTTTQRPNTLHLVAWNAFSISLVCAAGVLGWYVSVRSSRSLRDHPSEREKRQDDLTMNLWGQIFGYLCAALYLGSRIPQLLLNWRRKSTEGVSLLFFLFACIGNLTYVLSIFAYSPICAGPAGTCRPDEQARIYGRYLLVNASWLLGSLGTLFLDLGIFTQFILYRESEGDGFEEEEEEEEVEVGDGGGGGGGDVRWDRNARDNT